MVAINLQFVLKKDKKSARSVKNKKKTRYAFIYNELNMIWIKKINIF